MNTHIVDPCNSHYFVKGFTDIIECQACLWIGENMTMLFRHLMNNRQSILIQMYASGLNLLILNTYQASLTEEKEKNTVKPKSFTVRATVNSHWAVKSWLLIDQLRL